MQDEHNQPGCRNLEKRVWWLPGLFHRFGGKTVFIGVEEVGPAVLADVEIIALGDVAARSHRHGDEARLANPVVYFSRTFTAQLPDPIMVGEDKFRNFRTDFLRFLFCFLTLFGTWGKLLN